MMKINRKCNIQRKIAGVSNDRFKFTYANLNEGDKVRECYSHLKLIMQTHFHVVFFDKIVFETCIT